MDNDRIDIDSLIDFCENTTKTYAKVEENSYTEYIQNNIVDNFFYAILYILHDDFKDLPIDKKEGFIDDWKNVMYTFFKKNKRKFKKDDAQIITGGLMTSTKAITDQIIQVIVDIQDINIYIVNYNKYTIKVFYSKDSLNIYKKNIFIESKNNIFYPIMNNNNGIFYANSSIIQQIKNNSSMFNVTRNNDSSIIFLSKSEIESSFANKESEVANESAVITTANESAVITAANESAVITAANESAVITTANESADIKEYISKKNINFNKTGLNKIKIGELKEICGKYNIEINGKKKSEIVELILSS